MKFIGGKFGEKKRVYDEWSDTLKKNRAKGDNGNTDDVIEPSDDDQSEAEPEQAGRSFRIQNQQKKPEPQNQDQIGGLNFSNKRRGSPQKLRLEVKAGVKPVAWLRRNKTKVETSVRTS